MISQVILFLGTALAIILIFNYCNKTILLLRCSLIFMCYSFATILLNKAETKEDAIIVIPSAKVLGVLMTCFKSNGHARSAVKVCFKFSNAKQIALVYINHNFKNNIEVGTIIHNIYFSRTDLTKALNTIKF